MKLQLRDMIRFWKQVDKHGPIPETRPELRNCWNWKGFYSYRGYTKFSVKYEYEMCHRIAWRLRHGPIPEEKVIDHLCRNRRCVNPTHLEPVTHKENLMRGESFSAISARMTHCKRGHEFTPENTRLSFRRTATMRNCRTCAREYARLVRARNKSLANPARKE